MPIYIAARDLAGVPIGTHQFIVIEINSNPFPVATIDGKKIFIQNLGNWKMGYVIGTHNRGNLAVEFFEKSDHEATLEYFDKKRLRVFESDFDTQIIKVHFPNIFDEVAIKKVISLIEAYHLNELIDKINYPFAGIGFNCNSWAQTVIELAGGIVESNLIGLDISHDKRIPETYFEANCPAKPRPKIN